MILHPPHQAEEIDSRIGGTWLGNVRRSQSLTFRRSLRLNWHMCCIIHLMYLAHIRGIRIESINTDDCWAVKGQHACMWKDKERASLQDSVSMASNHHFNSPCLEISLMSSPRSMILLNTSKYLFKMYQEGDSLRIRIYFYSVCFQQLWWYGDKEKTQNVKEISCSFHLVPQEFSVAI